MILALALLFFGLSIGGMAGFYLGFEHAWAHARRTILKEADPQARRSPLSGHAKDPSRTPARFYGNLTPEQALDLDDNSITKIKGLVHPSAKELEEAQENNE